MIQIIGHRGASAYEPENTLRAFERAIEMGATMLELDVHLSRDGYPVVIHDEKLSRTTNGSGRVQDTTLEQIKALDAGKGEKVPTLSEVIGLARGRAQLYIELKGERTPGPVVEALCAAAFENQVIVGSFQRKLLEQIRLLDAKIRTSLLVGSKDRKANFVEWALAVGANYVHLCWERASRSPHKLLTPEMIAGIRRQGLGIVVWHEERPSELRELVKLDVDAVCSNKPDLLARILQEERGPDFPGASPSAVDVMMIGHFAKDLLVVDGHGEVASGGAVYYGGIALRRLGASVAVVTRLHTDDFGRLEDLERAGVQVFAAPAPETSGIANYYDSTDMERRICKRLGFAGAFGIREIPDMTAQIYLIGPIIAGEVDLPLLKSVAAKGPVALDVQGFVRVPEGRDLVFRQWAGMEEGLSCVTFLKVDRAEAELLTGETDLRIAARRLADYGPREVIVTQSSGVTILADDQIHTAPFTPRSLEGRTGRGDTCFATYVGRRLSAPPQVACRFAAAVTTLKLEQPGPWNGDLTAVQELLSDSNSRT